MQCGTNIPLLEGVMRLKFFTPLGALLVFNIIVSSNAFSKNFEQQTSIKAYGISFAEENNNDDLSHGVLEGEYKYNKKLNDHFSFKSHFAAFAATYPETTFSVPEFEITYKNGDTELALGRVQLEDSIFLDEDWRLGLQSAFVRMDPFRPQKQGLTGLFYKIKTEQLFIEFFGSPLFIPDQGPSIDVAQSGSVRTDNPWAFLPPERLLLSTGADLSLQYKLVEDSLPELLSEYQFGGRFKIKTKDLSLMGMYYNKPSRQLSFALDAKLESGGMINVEGRPLFSREHFYGLQAESYWFKKLKVKNGFYGLVHQEDKESSSRFQSANYDYFFATMSFEYDFDHFSTKLKYLFSNRKQNIEEDVVYFETSRFLFENAFGLEFSNLRWKRLSSQVGFVYAHKEEASQFYMDASWNFTEAFALFANMSLVHRFSDEDDSSTETVTFSSSGLSQYAALDNIQLGVQYVF